MVIRAVRAREHAVHDPRLRPVERRGEEAVRVVERQEYPAGEDRVEQVVLQRDGREIRRRFVADLDVDVMKPAIPSTMKRPRRPIMSAMRMRRSECRWSRSKTSKGAFIRDENACRRSSLEKRTKWVSSCGLDAVPDEAPQDVEEEDGAEDAADGRPAGVVAAKKTALPPVASMTSQNTVSAVLKISAPLKTRSAVRRRSRKAGAASAGGACSVCTA